MVTGIMFSGYLPGHPSIVCPFFARPSARTGYQKRPDIQQTRTGYPVHPCLGPVDEHH